MNEPTRVPMARPHAAFVPADVAAKIEKLPIGRRFYMDVNEEALHMMGRHALNYVTEDLAKAIVHRHSADIERVVFSYISDREWAEPVIRKAIYAAALVVMREIVASAERSVVPESSRGDASTPENG